MSKEPEKPKMCRFRTSRSTKRDDDFLLAPLHECQCDDEHIFFLLSVIACRLEARQSGELREMEK